MRAAYCEASPIIANKTKIIPLQIRIEIMYDLRLAADLQRGKEGPIRSASLQTLK